MGLFAVVVELTAKVVDFGFFFEAIKFLLGVRFLFAHFECYYILKELYQIISSFDLPLSVAESTVISYVSMAFTFKLFVLSNCLGLCLIFDIKVDRRFVQLRLDEKSIAWVVNGFLLVVYGCFTVPILLVVELIGIREFLVGIAGSTIVK